MKKTILSIFLGLILLQLVSAGFITVTPYNAERGNIVNVTLYPSSSDMACIGVINKEGGQVSPGFIHFECNSHCECFFPVSTTFNITSGMTGEYYASVWDNAIDDFSKGYFRVITNTCLNSIEDGNESDVDCGGEKCTKCNLQKKCKESKDCFSDYCSFENICEENKSIKNREKYSQRETFLVSDENWKNVLKLVPLTTWIDNSNTIKFPVLIYHVEGNKFDADSSINFIKDYNPTHITLFGKSLQKFESLLALDKKFGAGLNEGQISKVSFKDYYSYWNTINEVVVSKDDYSTGLMASVFASYKNAPLIFEDEIDYGAINRKKVYIIGDINETIMNKIKNIANETREYSLEELQKEYINITNTDRIILVNSNDKEIKLAKTFRTKKSSKIKEIYSKNSLVSPFLASVRQEAIINIKIPQSPQNSDCQESPEVLNNFNMTDRLISNKIEILFKEKPKYLTIISSPNSIPDSIYNKCHETGAQYRTSTDPIYAESHGKTMNVGRIYGVTVTDTSSYIMRDIFYNEISSKIYSSKATGLFIGHSFERYSFNSQIQNNASLSSGYDSLCYTGERLDGCIQKTSVPLTEYSNKQFILFGNHGSPNEWVDTLKSNKIPELDLSEVYSHACSTNNFWEGKEKLMSTNMIRQGAMAYHGAVGVSYSDNSGSEAIKKLTSSNLTLGELNKELSSEFGSYKNNYLMLGDPLLKPSLKEINWNGTEFYDNSIIEAETKPFNDKVSLISFSTQKENYSPGENVQIKTIVKNENNFSIEGYLEYNIFSTTEKYISELELQKIALKANSERDINFSMEVIDTIPSGNHKIIVRFLRDREELDKKEITFNVQNTLKDLDITLKSCEDVNCIEESQVFNKNETIYLDFESNYPSNITAVLRLPDQTQRVISLPYWFSSEREGNYVLLINATAEGYREDDQEMIFGIKDVYIPLKELCNPNKVCDNNETEQNCPQDCVIVNFPEENNNNNSSVGKNNSEDKHIPDITGDVIGEEFNDNYNNLEDSSYKQDHSNNINNVEKINEIKKIKVENLSNSKAKLNISYIIIVLFIFIFILLLIVITILIIKT